MHLLFLHPNYPAQFGHMARQLAQEAGFRCTFLSKVPAAWHGPVERMQFVQKGDATVHSHFCSCSFENPIWQSKSIFEALKARPDFRPDLVVGHSGFGSTLFLREIYDCPILIYFEYFYYTQDSEMDFRLELRSNEMERHRAWKPQPRTPRTICGLTNPVDIRLFIYVARGMESLRGFDIFCKMAKRICERRSDVLCLVAGQDRVYYAADLRHKRGKSFKGWVFAQYDYDVSRFRFLGLLPPTKLVRRFSLTDVHVYLSWSPFDAVACGGTVLASNTALVRELIAVRENGLLTDFYEVDEFYPPSRTSTRRAEGAPESGTKRRELIRRRHRLEMCLPRLRNLYCRMTRGERPPWIPESGNDGMDSNKMSQGPCHGAHRLAA
jgi:glycosyltransferase involved in cell wall biosynthesis